MLIKDAEKFFSKPYIVCICAIFCCLLWGSAFPCVKIGYSLFEIDRSSVPSLMLFAGEKNKKRVACLLRNSFLMSII